MSRLRLIDEVAYVRFASVFRQFPDVERFEADGFKEAIAERFRSSYVVSKGRLVAAVREVDFHNYIITMEKLV